MASYREITYSVWKFPLSRLIVIVKLRHMSFNVEV